jgi:hypothetical protein
MAPKHDAMHTSSLLQTSDFRYRRVDRSGSVPVEFADLFPDYHELDRVGVVSLRVEDGIRYAGGALLALTTAFYEALRSRGGPFFNYPQHFALLGFEEAATGAAAPDLGAVGPAWSNLDVWPESNWIAAPATATGMLRSVFDLQINRLFWPEELVPRQPAARLPGYTRRILGSRLKAVYHYGPAAPTMEVEGAPNVASLLRRSLQRLCAESDEEMEALLGTQGFRRVSASEFLETMAGCFEPE